MRSRVKKKRDGVGTGVLLLHAAADAQQIMEEESKIDHLKNKIMYSENFQMCLDLKEQFCAASNNPEQQRAILRESLNEYAKFGEDVTMI
ncbi:hypothetical protein RDI58_021997 [Solanum bulbocastanum]|uniref:Uncharacterized protein n=1 Tax=Solanum bulbocastanum TaxID=147425 RepID=A0AAN8T8L0_SOLBU